jgi:hypothetical protein
MIPSPGELFNDWWRNSGHHETGYEDVFYHDVPPGLAAEARRRERNESSKALKEPWPLTAWPETPTRYLLVPDWERSMAPSRRWRGDLRREPPSAAISASRLRSALSSWRTISRRRSVLRRRGRGAVSRHANKRFTAAA